jgi:hypothetical protein
LCHIAQDQTEAGWEMYQSAPEQQEAARMAASAYTGRLTWTDQQRSSNDDDAEQMKVLSALLGCLIVAEQTDCERSHSQDLLYSANSPRSKA